MQAYTRVIRVSERRVTSNHFHTIAALSYRHAPPNVARGVPGARPPLLQAQAVQPRPRNIQQCHRRVPHAGPPRPPRRVLRQTRRVQCGSQRRQGHDKARQEGCQRVPAHSQCAGKDGEGRDGTGHLQIRHEERPGGGQELQGRLTIEAVQALGVSHIDFASSCTNSTTSSPASSHPPKPSTH